MQTDQANIWYNKNTFTYILYSPLDGINKVVENYVGIWASPDQWCMTEYETMDDLDLDAVHYELVTLEGLRVALLQSAKKFMHENP